jgi:(2Fe-2S) ferredoxin
VVELEEFLVSYQREPGGAWYQEWDSAGIPELVSMQLKAGGRFWPELVVRMR